MKDKIAIYLTPEEALLFTEYQKRYAFMKFLESIDGFNLKSASITINFDNMGRIGSVDKKQHFSLPL